MRKDFYRRVRTVRSQLVLCRDVIREASDDLTAAECTTLSRHLNAVGGASGALWLELEGILHDLADRRADGGKP